MQDIWQEHFWSLTELTETLPAHRSDPHALAATLLQALVKANDFTFDRAPAQRLGKGAQWWTDACTGALALLRAAHPDNRKHAFARLRQVIRTAKIDWAETVLTEATNNVDHHALWSVAKWRKRRSNPIIPPIDGA
jgi:hypothetical protein